LFSLLYQNLYSQAKNIKFQNFYVENGMAGSKVNCLLVDHKGYLWIGTSEGLNKFDANQFKTYKHNRADKNTINSNVITQIFEDRDKKIWVCTTSGICYYNREKDIFIPVDFQINEKKSDDIYITNGIEDKSGIFWLSTSGHGILKYDRNTGKTEVFSYSKTNPASLRSNFVWAITQDKNDKLWFGSDSGLFNFRPNFKTKPDFHKIDLGQNVETVFMVQNDRQGNIWAGALSLGLFCIESVSEKYKFYNTTNSNLSLNIPYSFFQDADDKIWIGTYKGLNVFQPKSQSFINFFHYPNKPSSLSDNCVWCMEQDKSGVIWIGTHRGLNKYDKRIEQFRHYENNPDDNKSLVNNFIFSFCQESDTTIWVGTSNGLDLFNTKNGTFEHHLSKLMKEETPKAFSIRGLAKDNYGNLWVGSWGKGIFKYHIKTGKVENFQYQKDDTKSISNNFIRILYFDKENVMWVGSVAGLSKFIPETKQFVNYIPIAGDSTSLSGRYVYEIMEDSKNNLWAGTLYNGFNKFDRKTGKCIQYLNKKSDLQSLSSSMVNCIFESSNGTIWIGTRNGLNRFTPETGTFEMFNTVDGLSNETVLGIIEDGNQCLWLSTNFGISKFDPQKKTFKNYFYKDGLQSNEFTGHSSLKTSQGDFLFGGVNGFNIFKPEHLSDNTFIPNIVLTDLKISNRSVKINEQINDDVILLKDISETDQIDLSYKNNVFSIDFTALDFTAPQFNQYAYKLEGFDNEWIKTSAERRFATYTNLDGGKYTFKVKCSNSSGIWNENYKSLIIVIHPPFWYTWWFKTLIIIIIVSSTTFWVFMRIKGIKKQKEHLEIIVKKRTAEILIQKEEIQAQNEQLQLLNETKDKFFGIIGHDLRNPFNALLGFSEILYEGAGELDTEMIKSYSKFLNEAARSGYNLLENLLHWSLSQTGKIEYSPQRLSLFDIIDQAVDTLKNVAMLKNIELSFTTEKQRYVFADSNLTDAVLRNLISNAIKFTHKNGKIDISTQLNETEVIIIIQDNGVGISPDMLKTVFGIKIKKGNLGTENEKGTGLGLTICKEFVEIQRGRIWVESELSKGSRFCFTLPAVV